MFCSVSVQAAELRRIGVSLTDLGNPFFIRIARGVESAARRIGGRDVQVMVASSAYDIQRQSSQIDAFIAKKVDLIILNAADPTAIGPAVQRAKAAGIRVIAVDVRAAEADATVTTDNVMAGHLACDYIAHRLKGRGNVVIINGPKVSATLDRVQGCVRVLSTFPDIKVLSWERDGGGSAEGGFTKMTDLLTSFPRIDGVFAINDPTAIGAEMAAHQAGRSDFIIVGVDGAPQVATRMRDAASLIAGSVAQSPGQLADKAVELGVALLKGRTLPNREVLMAPRLITREVLQDYHGWDE